MGRRRRRVIRIVKKKLPTVFVCPRCGEEAVRVTIAKDTGKAMVLCALCNLRDDFQAHPAAQMIDVYSYFTDRFYGVKDPRPIIPKERKTHPIPVEEEEEASSEPVPIETAIVESEPQLPITVGNVEGTITTANQPQQAHGPEEASTKEAEQPAETNLEADSSRPAESTQSPEEDNEPFADILQSKDKKRYSPNPLPQESSE